MVFIKKLMRTELNGEIIRPPVLRRWERISRDLDRGRGRTFTSVKAMHEWLKKL